MVDSFFTKRQLNMASSNVPQRIRDFLAYHGGEAEIGEICQHAFAAQMSPALARRLLETALPSELKFSEDKVVWLRPNELADDPRSAKFIVVDLETTGTAPAYSEIIEFGAVFVSGGKILGEEQCLFRPSGKIPPFIERLTGIDDSMVADADQFDLHAARIHQLFAGAIPVAHNADFDCRFLDAAFLKAGLHPIGGNRLCTLKLARALLPGRKFNLDALSERLQIQINGRHRALGDAKATAHILIELLRLAEKQGYRSISALRKIKSQRGKGAETKVVIGPERVRAIPTGPGVYRFRDAQGQVVYVGKAKNLQKRLGSYFIGSPKGKVSQMLTEVRDFDYTVVGSELEALLEEAKEIRMRQPKYNRALRTFGKYGYLRLERQDPFSALRFTKEKGNETLYESFGPFRFRTSGQYEVKALRETFFIRNCRGRLNPSQSVSPCVEHSLMRCMAPCSMEEDVPSYGQHILQLRSFLEGDPAALRNLRQKMLTAAEEENFERAAALRDRYRILVNIHQGIRRKTELASQGDRIVILPAAEAGLLKLYLVRPGSYLTSNRVNPDGANWVSVAERLLSAKSESAEIASQEDTRLAEQWLRLKKNAVPVVSVTDFSDPVALGAALQGLANRALKAV